jgi:metal-responsive CopG/Arc/MetJ family transcriptional regulator
MKVTISLDDELMNRVDDYASKIYMSRSGFVSLACSQYLNNAQAILAVQDLAFSMRKIADMGYIDEETKLQLEDFSRLSEILVGGIKPNK